MAGTAASVLLAAMAPRRRAFAAPAIPPSQNPPRSPSPGGYPVTHTDAEWRRILTPDQYAILRQEGTEAPYTSPLLHETREGFFSCAGCGQPMFSSRVKYDSHTGWPSFWTAAEGAYLTSDDHKLNFLRTEMHCSRCGSHLGHIFDDGPKPTGLRYCMDGLALMFTPV